MRMNVRTVVLGVLMLCLGMTAFAQDNVVDEVVWVVGDEAILKSEVEEARLQAIWQGRRFEADAYCVIPEEIAVQKLFLHQAELDSIEVSESEVISQVDFQTNQYIAAVGSREKMEEYFNKTSSQIRETLRENVRDGLRVREMQRKLVGDVKELKFVKKTVVSVADEEIANAKSDLKYEVGTMIEIPRACLTADEIAKEADFFCFGTNDLTQMTFGFSRDDAGKFLGAYYDNKIYENDPFAKLDQIGVGKLMKMAVTLGREARKDLSCGICGEHGGDPSSVEFCHQIGLDYVSCSPYRVPIARLAAAQAALK